MFVPQICRYRTKGSLCRRRSVEWRGVPWEPLSSLGLDRRGDKRHLEGKQHSGNGHLNINWGRIFSSEWRTIEVYRHSGKPSWPFIYSVYIVTNTTTNNQCFHLLVIFHSSVTFIGFIQTIIYFIVLLKLFRCFCPHRMTHTFD